MVAENVIYGGSVSCGVSSSQPGVSVIVLTMALRPRYRNMCRFNSGVRSTFHPIHSVLTRPPSSSIATH